MQRFILRAEIHTARETFVTYGYDLTPQSVFVVTDWRGASVDTRITVRLSVPRALEPVDVACRIAAFRVAGNPGDVAGMVLEFDADAPRPSVLALLDQVQTLRGEASSLSQFRVLLVEDNGLTRDVFAYSAHRYFGTDDALVIDHAESAEKAWELLTAAEYDLVIVDYFLPNADGATLISRLRADTARSRIPVVAISVGGRSAREATMTAGADLFVDKPVVFRDLFNTMRILAHVSLSPEAKRTILVLDDSALALAVTRAALEAAGFTVVIADDLAGFEREFARCQPDLILVDVQMPEMFGDDIAATLLGTKRVVDVPVVLFSSLEENELARRSSQASATGYISKAAGMTELVRRCREYLGSAA